MEHVCKDDLATLKPLGNGTYQCPKCGRYYMETYGGSGVKKMEVSMATSTKCPYCDKRVAMFDGAIGDHNTHGGACDGSRREVASFDSSGRAVLMASDISGTNIQVGDEVIDRKSSSTNPQKVVQVEADHVRLADGSRLWAKDCKLA